MSPDPNIYTNTLDSKEARRLSLRHAQVMDDAEIERLRRAICRSFNSSPHKKKYWLALLEIHSAGREDVSRSHPSRDLHASPVNSVDSSKNRPRKDRVGGHKSFPAPPVVAGRRRI